MILKIVKNEIDRAAWIRDSINLNSNPAEPMAGDKQRYTSLYLSNMVPTFISPVFKQRATAQLKRMLNAPHQTSHYYNCLG